MQPATLLWGRGGAVVSTGVRRLHAGEPMLPATLLVTKLLLAKLVTNLTNLTNLCTS